MCLHKKSYFHIGFSIYFYLSIVFVDLSAKGKKKIFFLCF
jgi:hypothetical protein